MTTTDIYATIEYIRYGEAILSMTDGNGEWAGAGLVQCRSGRRSDLYEQGYINACVSASSKGARVVRYSEVAP